jgi:hypothetical protein
MKPFKFSCPFGSLLTRKKISFLSSFRVSASKLIASGFGGSAPSRFPAIPAAFFLDYQNKFRSGSAADLRRARLFSIAWMIRSLRKGLGIYSKAPFRRASSAAPPGSDNLHESKGLQIRNWSRETEAGCSKKTKGRLAKAF